MSPRAARRRARPPGLPTRAADFPLLTSLLERRSRRFGAGFRLNGGPLAFESQRPPQPLSVEEEAVLSYAACGVSGYALSELPFGTGDVPDAGGGHIMVHFAGRTIASGDAMHLCAVFVVMLVHPRAVRALPGDLRAVQHPRRLPGPSPGS
jgi:hypothetical protein